MLPNNAPIFTTNFLGFTRCIKLCFQNRRKCCPMFCHELFGVIRCIKFVFKTGGNAAQFFPTKFFGDDLMYQRYCSFRTGGNAAQFFAMSFWGHSMHQFLVCLERGKCCPIFPHKLFWYVSMYQISCSEKGEMLPNFPHKFFGVIRPIKFWVRNRGKCCPIFPHELMAKNRALPPVLNPKFDTTNDSKKLMAKNWAAFPPALNTNFDTSSHPKELMAKKMGAAFPPVLNTRNLIHRMTPKSSWQKLGSISSCSEHNLWYVKSPQKARGVKLGSISLVYEHNVWYAQSAQNKLFGVIRYINFCVFRTGGNAAQFFAMSFLESFDASNFC